MRGIFVVLFVAALAARAHAQSGAEQWEQCNDPSSLDTVIKACTEVIDAKREPRDRLAMAFNNRGYAYTRQSKYDLGMADLDQSIYRFVIRRHADALVMAGR